jgi:hypothetical protein
MYRMRISLRPAEPGRSSFRVTQPGVADVAGERAAQLRPGFKQHADGLADLDRAGPVPFAQVVQPGPDLRCHDQGIGHASRLPRSGSITQA